MQLIPRLISYEYRSKNIGTGKKRSTLIIEAREGDVSGYCEVYAAAYMPKICLMMAEAVITKYKYAKVPFCTESGIGRAVMGCMDIATTDLRYRLEGRTLGTKEGLIPYASGGSVALTPEEIRGECEAAKASGYDYYKLRLSPDQWLIAEKRIGAAMVVFGPGRVAVDMIANTLGAPNQRAWPEVMDSMDLLWIEEPRPAIDMTNWHFSKEHKVVAGEWASTEGELEQMNRITGNLQVDFTQFGFFSRENFLNKIAAKSGIIAIHCWCSQMSSAIGRLAGRLVTETPVYLECPLVESELNDHTHPSNTGLRFDLDQDWLEHATYTGGTEFSL